MDSGLNQRDRANSAASYIKRFRSDDDVFRFVGCRRGRARAAVMFFGRARAHRRAWWSRGRLRFVPVEKTAKGIFTHKKREKEEEAHFVVLPSSVKYFF